MKTKLCKLIVILIVSFALVFIYNHYSNRNIIYHQDHRDDIEQIVPKGAKEIKEYGNEPGGINAVFLDERESHNVIYLSYVYGIVVNSPTIKEIDFKKNKVTIEVLEPSHSGAALFAMTSHTIEIPVNKEIDKIEIKEVNKGPYYLSKIFTSMFVVLKKFGISVSQLKSLNDLRSDVITIGQILKVK